MTLVYNTAGGPGSVNKEKSKGHWAMTCLLWEQCPPTIDSNDIKYEGAYDPESKTFDGTWTMQYDSTTTTHEPDECDTSHDSGSMSGTWHATLTDGTIEGNHEGGDFPFTLTVQG